MMSFEVAHSMANRNGSGNVSSERTRPPFSVISPNMMTWKTMAENMT